MSKTEDEILQLYEAIESQSRRPCQDRGRGQDVRTGSRQPRNGHPVSVGHPPGPAPGARRPPSSTPRRPSPKRTVSAIAAPSASSAPMPWPPVIMAPAWAALPRSPPQMVNHLINRDQLVFCKSCGRLLYLGEVEERELRSDRRSEPATRPSRTPNAGSVLVPTAC